MKSKISFFYHQSLETFKKMTYILKLLDKKYLYKLIFLFISMLFGAVFELIFLVSLSVFIKIVLNNGLLDNTNNSSNDVFNYFYLNLLNFFSNFTESNIVSNCFVFIFISLLALSIRLLTLRIVLVQTAEIGAFIEAKCGESLMEVPYKFYRDIDISIILTDFYNIPKFVNIFFRDAIQSISSLMIIIFLSLYLKIKSEGFFVFAFLLIAAIYIVTLLLNINNLKLLSNKTKKLNIEKTSNINFIVRMFRHILLEQKEKKSTAHFGSIVTSIYKYNAQGLLISLYPRIIIEYAAIISIAILLIIQTIIYGPTKSIENVGIFLVALLRILTSIQILYVFLVKIGKRRFVLDSVYDLLNLPNEKKENYISLNSLTSSRIVNSIQLKNVSFKYSKKETNIINNFSYEFISGKSYAIVGGSGSGKSTLIDIILNLLAPQEGHIVINKKYKLSNQKGDKNTSLIRSNTLLIGQNDFYCGDRIKDILEISLEDETNQFFIRRLKKAIDYLQINEIFENNFINSFIGENGSKISGGQRQRMILLKALISKKNILIFDEATSSLDDDTKNLVIKFLLSPKVFTKNRILIFSTHSNKVAESCDSIIKI